MERADVDNVAELPDLLRATEQQLLTYSRLCHQLWLESGRLSLAEVGPHRTPAPAAPAETAANGNLAVALQELANQVQQLASSLAWQAAALGATIDASVLNRRDPSREHTVLRAYEAERARVARDLHDGPAQYFANAVFEAEYLERVLSRDPEALAAGLMRLRSGLQHGVDEIRRCLFDLRLPQVEQIGVVALVRGYLAEYERQFGVAVSARLPTEELPVSADQAIAIFRILQEALSNTRKHAGAQHIRVMIGRRDSDLTLLVEDDGCGFAEDQREAGKYGLIGMHERAQLIGGHLEIKGRLGEGARVQLRVPLR